VSAVISLHERKSLWRIWQSNFRWTVLHMLVAALLGVAIAAIYHSMGLWGTFLFVAPLLLASYAFRLFTETKRDIIDFVGVLAGVIDEVDPYTRQHSERVARTAVQIARAMQLPEHEVETIEFAALLHDLGKIKMQHRDLLLRPMKLSEEEKRSFANHAAFGAAMAAKIRSLKKTSEIVMAHHERMDGRGYPRGLLGAQVPLGSRIINVSDAFDAMTTDRVYRKALPVQEALEELRRHSGSQFDGEVVACLTRLAVRGELETGGSLEAPAAARGETRESVSVSLSPAG
jgi:putative nucleotidyltransferase with HDIG domain